MKRTSFIILTVIMFIVASTATLLIACDDGQYQEQGHIIHIDAIDITQQQDELTAPGKEMYEPVEDELPPESFVGTVIEEDSYYMVVEPNSDEEELTSYGKKVRVEFITENIDFRYGIGRKVVITYIPPRNGTTITTDDIRTDGFEEFKLSVQYRDDTIPARFAEIQYAGFLKLIANNRDFIEDASDYNLYYYGLHDVYVTVDGDTLPLIEALTYGKVTIDGIIAECNRLNALSGYTIATEYKDGGSILYDFNDFRIIKYHTIDGNRDVYIGTIDMDINAVNATSLCITGSEWKDLGIRLSLKDVTPEGATVIFKHSGGSVSGELQTGEAFYLEKLDGNKWVWVETKPLIDYAFHQVAYMISTDGETELETKWEWLYGSLEEGQYRISKEVTDFKASGNYDKQVYYAYFEIKKELMIN